MTDSSDRSQIEKLEELITQERGELTELDRRVLESLADNELVTRDTGAEYSERATLGDRLADHMASFGGSWWFLILFSGFLVVWIAYNALVSGTAKFDPFPFILLNLMLSCLAAVQAPIIMMSQNRQEAKDRMRGEHDYEVNLKAELEIRQLHLKIDQLLKHQWQRLLEIQELQLELLQKLRDESAKK